MERLLVVEVKDRNGKLLRRHAQVPHSYVQAYNFLICSSFKLDGHALVACERTNGSSTSIYVGAGKLRANGPSGNTNYGIVIGTGDTAVAVTDYALGALIAQGVGAGQMEYQAETIGSASVSGSDCSFTSTRVMVNNSGSSITVKEAGIVMCGYYSGSPNVYYLAARDVLVSPLAVPDGGSITVTYVITHSA